MVSRPWFPKSGHPRRRNRAAQGGDYNYPEGD